MVARRRVKKRRLIVPLALAVTVAAGAASVATSQLGCGDDDPKQDASVGDGQPDTPVL